MQNYHFVTAWFNSSETGKDIAIVCFYTIFQPPTTTELLNPVKRTRTETSWWYIHLLFMMILNKVGSPRPHNRCWYGWLHFYPTNFSPSESQWSEQQQNLKSPREFKHFKNVLDLFYGTENMLSRMLLLVPRGNVIRIVVTFSCLRCFC